MERRSAGFLLMVLSGACFGALGLFGRLAYAAGVDVPTLLFLRFSLAGGSLLCVMLARRQRFPRGRVLLSLVLLGAVGYVGEALCYFSALTLASAGLEALLLYLYPALVALLSVVVNGEHLGRLKTVAVGLALGGTALTFFAGLERVGPVNASLLSTLEPVMAVLLGALFLGERLSLRQGVGGLLILMAVVLLARLDSARR